MVGLTFPLPVLPTEEKLVNDDLKQESQLLTDSNALTRSDLERNVFQYGGAKLSKLMSYR